jgi:hypothetical protein
MVRDRGRILRAGAASLGIAWRMRREIRMRRPRLEGNVALIHVWPLQLGVFWVPTFASLHRAIDG